MTAQGVLVTVYKGARGVLYKGEGAQGRGMY